MSGRRLITFAAAALLLTVLQPATAWPDTTQATASEYDGGRPNAHLLPQAEVAFDHATEQVTVRVSPRHLSGVRMPFPIRERLALFEDGVRRSDVAVDVEHSPITLAVLVENGGRSHQLNASVTADAGLLVRPLLDVLQRHDRLAMFAFDDSVRTLVDFDTPHEQWSAAVGRLPRPRFSETNFYDATLTVLDRLATTPGRKALLVLSTGIDTFSRSGFEDVIAKAEQTKVPIYVFNLAELARRRLSPSMSGLLGRVDWARCEQQLERLAEASGGRAYLTIGSDVASAYDDIMEDLRVRYVLTYRSSIRGTTGRRTIQVAVLNAVARGPRQTVATSTRARGARVIAEASYTPSHVAADASALVDTSQRR